MYYDKHERLVKIQGRYALIVYKKRYHHSITPSVSGSFNLAGQPVTLPSCVPVFDTIRFRNAVPHVVAISNCLQESFSSLTVFGTNAGTDLLMMQQLH